MMNFKANLESFLFDLEVYKFQTIVQIPIHLELLK